MTSIASHEPPMAGRHGGWRPTPLMLTAFAMIVGALLRFYRLDHQSLWMDEISSLRNARAFGAGGITALAQADQVAPLHSITLWLATLAGGDGAVALRMPSVLAGIALIPLMYLLGARIVRAPWTGAIAAMIVAISPYDIWYSQEARMYALLLLCTAAYAIVAWPVVVRALRPWELALLTIITAIGFGMHHYMALMCGAFGLFLLVQGLALRPRAWAWLGTQVIAFLMFAVWLYLTRDRLGNVAGTEKPSFLLWIPYTFYTYIAGFSFGPSTRQIQEAGTALKGVILGDAPAIALLAMAAALLMAAAIRRGWRGEERAATRWLLIWLVAPVLIAVLATRLTNIRYNVRYVIVCYPALILLFAMAVEMAAARLRDWRAGARAGTPIAAGGVMLAAGIVGVCMILSDVHHFTDDRYAKEDVRSLARALDRLPADAVIVSDNNRIVKVLRYYHGRLPGDDVQVDYRTNRLTPDRVWANLMAIPPARRRDIALIEYRSWEADPRASLKTRIAAIADPRWSARYPGTSVTLYRVRSDR